MNTPIKIMLVEDNKQYRDVIDFGLKSYDNMTLCEQFSTVEIALRSLSAMTPENTPDVILLDVRLPGMNGLDAIPHFRMAAPDTKIIILTQSNTEKDVVKAITLGASGYLLKASSIGEITDGIQTVMDQGASLDAGVAKYILSALHDKLPKNEIIPDVHLTDRELETLTLLSDGLLKKEIAKQLQISITTVATHIGNVYKKLKVPNAPAAVSKAYKSGILPTDIKKK